MRETIWTTLTVLLAHRTCVVGWHQTLSSVIIHHSLPHTRLAIPHTRLAIHLQGCNYFALSSLEGSHYYSLHINLALQSLLRTLIDILCLFACFKNKAYVCVKVAFVTSDELYTFILWF